MSRYNDEQILADLAESGHGYSIVQMPVPHLLEDEPIAYAWSKGQRVTTDEDPEVVFVNPMDNWSDETWAQVRAYQEINKKVDEDRLKRLRKTP